MLLPENVEVKLEVRDAKATEDLDLERIHILHEENESRGVPDLIASKNVMRTIEVFSEEEQKKRVTFDEFYTINQEAV